MFILPVCVLNYFRNCLAGFRENCRKLYSEFLDRVRLEQGIGHFSQSCNVFQFPNRVDEFLTRWTEAESQEFLKLFLHSFNSFHSGICQATGMISLRLQTRFISLSFNRSLIQHFQNLHSSFNRGTLQFFRQWRDFQTFTMPEQITPSRIRNES